MPDASIRPPGPEGQPAARRVTLKDIARALGVSPATVSNAYNRPDQLSPELRGRVLELAQSLGYSGPDPLASSLRRGRSGAVGVLYSAPLSYAFLDPAAALFLGGLGRGLSEGAAGPGTPELNLLLLPAGSSAAAVLGASVDGFVVYSAPDADGEPAGGGSGVLGAVLGRGLPAVLVDQRPLAGTASVGIDDYGGAFSAARHLSGLGHRHLGVLGLPLALDRQAGPVDAERERQMRFRVSIERLRGYRDAAREAGIRLTVWEAAGNTSQDGERLASALLTAEPEITALLCMSDVLAFGALAAAQRLGLRVPAALSVIGYDDLPTAASLDLSSVSQPTERKGLLAAEALLSLLAGAEPTQVTLPTRLSARGSSGPVRR